MAKEKPKRSWGVSEQKIVGARQEWRCAHCNELLPASYEVDHKVPLWEGGADCVDTNAEALCCNCHGSKTQRESIRRRDEYRARQDAAAAAAKLKSERSDEPPKRRKLTVDEEWAKKEAFLVDNPFLKFVYEESRP